MAWIFWGIIIFVVGMGAGAVLDMLALFWLVDASERGKEWEENFDD